MSSRHTFMGDSFGGPFATRLAGVAPESPSKRMGQGLVCCTRPDGSSPCFDTNYQGTGQCAITHMDTSNAQHAPCGPNGQPPSCGAGAPPPETPPIEPCADGSPRLPDGSCPPPPYHECEPPEVVQPDGSCAPPGNGGSDVGVACPNGDGTFTITSIGTGEIINSRASAAEANQVGHILHEDDPRCGGPGFDRRCSEGYEEQPDGSCLPICAPGQERLPDGTCAAIPVEQTCPDGSIMPPDGICQAPPVEPTCPAGQLIQPDGSCLCPDGLAPQPDGSCPTAPECGPGEELNAAGVCVPIPTTCPVGEEIGPDGLCAPIGCPPGEEFQDGICAPIVEEFCPDGSIMPTDGICPPPVCIEGEELNADGVCAPIEVVCPEGEELDAYGACVPIEVVCPEGEVLYDDGTCGAPPVEPTVCPEGEVLYDDGTCGVPPVEPPIEPPIPGQPIPVTPPPVPGQPVTVTPPPVILQPPITGQPPVTVQPTPTYVEPPYVEPPTAGPLPQPACPPGQVLLDDGTCCLEEVCGVIQIEECPDGQVRYADGLCADPPLACEGEGEIYDLYDADTGELISSGVPYSDVPEEADIVSADDPRCGLPVDEPPLPVDRIPVPRAPGAPGSLVPLIYPCNSGFGQAMQGAGLTARPFYSQPF